MKRIVVFCLIAVLLLGLGGCVVKEKQEALLNYINNDVIELGNIENELLASYGSVTGDNYANDLVTYTEFTTNTLQLAQQLNNKAVSITNGIEDEEILEIHRLYMNYSSKMLNTITIMVSAIEKQDALLMSQANEELNEANNAVLDYKLALNELAEKYGVEILKK